MIVRGLGRPGQALLRGLGPFPTVPAPTGGDLYLGELEGRLFADLDTVDMALLDSLPDGTLVTIDETEHDPELVPVLRSRTSGQLTRRRSSGSIR
jgi:hypothetical protein